MSIDFETWMKERDEVLPTLDLPRIREHMRKYGTEPPTDDFVLLGAIHKAITGNLGLPTEVRRKSKDWLTTNNLHSYDDGDLT